MWRRGKYDAMRYYTPNPYYRAAVVAHMNAVRYRKHRKKILAGVLVYMMLTRNRRRGVRDLPAGSCKAGNGRGL